MYVARRNNRRYINQQCLPYGLLRMRRAYGFTLIELLVVLMVMSLVLSLVGPAIQKVYAQHMAQQEMRLLTQYVRNASAYAFAQHEVIVIKADGNQIWATEKPQDSLIIEQESSSPGYLSQEDAYPVSYDLDPAYEDQTEQPLFNHRFDYLRLHSVAFEALPSGYITLDSLQVSIGSGEITKDVALRGLRFTQWYQG